MDSRFNGFAINLELDGEDAGLVHFVEAPEISAFGGTPEEALVELVVAWEAVKETYRAEGSPVPAPARKSHSALNRNLATEGGRDD